MKGSVLVHSVQIHAEPNGKRWDHVGCLDNWRLDCQDDNQGVGTVAKGQPPAFQLYANDWISSLTISSMTPAQEGAYIRLLCYQWADKDCSLPSDDTTLRKLSRLDEQEWNEMRTFVERLFAPVHENGERLANARMRKYRENMNARKYRCAEAGRKSGESRRLRNEQALNGRSSYVERNTNTSSSSSSSSSISNKKEEDPYSDEFKAFWKMYPKRNGRKVGKHETWMLFKKVLVSDHESLMHAAKNYQSAEFVRDPVRFLKNDWWRDWIENAVVEDRTPTAEDLKHWNSTDGGPALTGDWPEENK